MEVLTPLMAALVTNSTDTPQGGRACGVVASLENGLQSPKWQESTHLWLFSGSCGFTEAASSNGIPPQDPTSETIGGSLKKAAEHGIGDTVGLRQEVNL